jgi:hypothetical protein
MDRPGRTVLVIKRVVGAGPAIQRRSVMPRASLTNPVIVAELVMPGFADDLSTWKFSVDAEGTAVQEAVVANVKNMFRGEPRTFTARVPKAEVATLLAVAKEGGFDRFAARYGADHVTDLPTTALSFEFDGELKRVEAYGAGWLAYEGSDEMKVFHDLWQRIERHLPYGGA